MYIFGDETGETHQKSQYIKHGAESHVHSLVSKRENAAVANSRPNIAATPLPKTTYSMPNSRATIIIAELINNTSGTVAKIQGISVDGESTHKAQGKERPTRPLAPSAMDSRSASRYVLSLSDALVHIEIIRCHDF